MPEFYTRVFAHALALATHTRTLRTLLAFCEDPSDYSRVPIRHLVSFFNLPADGTVNERDRRRDIGG